MTANGRRDLIRRLKVNIDTSSSDSRCVTSLQLTLITTWLRAIKTLYVRCDKCLQTE